ncbi:alpha/beta hydrolase [Salininema proteolyticum]|uniref:Alpha/beta hydrolase n=1 Tax=Salininema proteolyticum TaxID=1607685 RepID=A0ABV8U4Q7_9ACTN
MEHPGRLIISGLLGGAVVLSTATAVQAAPNEEGIDWRACADEPAADCAELEVPLDWDDPEGPTTTIALARMSAGDPDARLGSVVINPGGPGGSGVNAVKNESMGSEALRENYDIVGFDPRGVGGSDPIMCSTDLTAEWTASLNPEGPREYAQNRRLGREVQRDCDLRSSGVTRYADTYQTAHDIEAIRIALGEVDLNYLGASYGTLMGQQYAELFGDNVGSMVLDGNMDHALPSAREFMFSEVAPVEENFLQFAEWCTGSEACDLSGQDVSAVYDEVKKKARAGELEYAGAPLDFYGLSSSMVAITGYTQYWQYGGTFLKQLNETGSADPLEPAIAETVAAQEETNQVMQAVWCNDFDFQTRNYREYDAIRADLAESYPNVEWSHYASYALTCNGYRGEPSNPRRPFVIDDDVPLVMVGTVNDFATVYEWNVAAAEQADAPLVTYEGFGHTIYGLGSDCVDAALDGYFMDGVEPADGLSCPPADPNPGAPRVKSLDAPVSPGSVLPRY